MRELLGRYLDDLALDDAIKVVLLRGEGGVFSTGADMGNAYAWYDSNGSAGENGSDGEQPRKPRRPSQRRRLRSEEHTSELKSIMRISYAVFCLKKKTPTHHTH